MVVAILVPTLLENDAIGNDVCHQLRILKERNIPAFIYAEEIMNVHMQPYCIDTSKLLVIIKDPGNVVIYHHGGCWHRGMEILEKVQCKLFIKYHNITPPHFFKPYNASYEKYCSDGILQTTAIIGLKKEMTFLCDSNFNAADLMSLRADERKMEILPPFHKLDDFKKAGIDGSLAHDLRDGKVNLLFVGRLVPNKGHKHLIDVIAEYVKMYDADIRLNIVGGIDPALNLYATELKASIEQNGLHDIVRLTGGVSFDTLHTYYQFSHLFLVMSAHEGFCIPVLEAQFHSLPVIAWNAGAVGETVGHNQIVFEEKDERYVAAAIRVVSQHAGYKNYLSVNGLENIGRFSNKRIEMKFLNVLGIENSIDAGMDRSIV